MGEANDSDMDLEAGPSKPKEFLHTYKRRKYYKTAAEGRVLVAGETRFGTKEGLRFVNSTPGACSFNHQRNIILQEICQSLEHDGALKECIHDALAFHPENGPRTLTKKSASFCEFEIQSFSTHGHSTNTMKESIDMACNRSAYGSKRFGVTDLCCCTFSDIIMSESFSKLCTLLYDNGMKAHKLLDFRHINLKIKENAYESSPSLFQSDILQVLSQIEKLGNDIVNLARSISVEAMASFQAKVLKPVNVFSADVRNEVLTERSDKPKEVRVESSFNELHTCRQCGKKADGTNGLVCDSCEMIYHISCADPPVIKEIPTKSWCCINCAIKGIGSPHDNCVVCERMSSQRFPGCEEDEFMCSKGAEESTEKDLPNCKVCHDTIINGEDQKACGHSLCPHKFYHVKCLMSNELQSHAHCWYCPSCLCRACLVDQDDDKIVLCDGCDHGFHIYCMKPPRDSIPKGQWFCERCDADIRNIQKAKCLYENSQTKSSRRCPNGNVKMQIRNVMNKSGGVDMLLNAARTLKHEERLHTTGLKA